MKLHTPVGSIHPSKAPMSAPRNGPSFLSVRDPDFHKILNPPPASASAIYCNLNEPQFTNQMFEQRPFDPNAAAYLPSFNQMRTQQPDLYANSQSPTYSQSQSPLSQCSNYPQSQSPQSPHGGGYSQSNSPVSQTQRMGYQSPSQSYAYPQSSQIAQVHSPQHPGYQQSSPGANYQQSSPGANYQHNSPGGGGSYHHGAYSPGASGYAPGSSPPSVPSPYSVAMSSPETSFYPPTTEMNKAPLDFPSFHSSDNNTCESII